jgi:hypothetical protein
MAVGDFELTVVRFRLSLFKVRGVVQITSNFLFETMDEIWLETVGMPKGSKIAVKIHPQIIEPITPIPEIDQGIGQALVKADG